MNNIVYDILYEIILIHTFPWCRGFTRPCASKCSLRAELTIALTSSSVYMGKQHQFCPDPGEDMCKLDIASCHTWSPLPPLCRPTQAREKRLCSNEFDCLQNGGRYHLNTTCSGLQSHDPLNDGKDQAVCALTNPCQFLCMQMLSE